MRLESFLQVPKGGLDWTCPADFNGEFGHESILYWGEVNTPEAKESITKRIDYIKKFPRDNLDYPNNPYKEDLAFYFE